MEENVRYVQVLGFKESIKQIPIVKYIRETPQAQVTLIAGFLTMIGGGLKLASKKYEFDDVVFTTRSDGDIIRLNCKVAPTLEFKPTMISHF